MTAPEEDINNNDLVKHFNPMNMNKDKDLIKNEEEIPTRKIFIDHVICNDTKFNDIEVRDHVYTIVAAGSETTALQTAHTSKTLQIALIFLSNNFSFPFQFFYLQQIRIYKKKLLMN